MSIYSEFSPQNIIGVDVFLERFQTRIYVGKLEKREDKFHFIYDPTYLKAKNVLPLGPEFSLTRAEFVSKDLFPSFADRLPDPNNPAYPDYCAATGISPDVSEPIILLSTIGKRGPSSFIFEPIYKETFNYADCEQFREQLGLSMQDFANLFDVSLSILQKIKAGETSGKEVLKRLEQYFHFPESLDLQIKRNAKWLHSKKQNLILKENIIILNFLKDILLKFDDENNPLSLEEAINLASRADICYSILTKTDLKFSASKGFNDDKDRFIYEIKPIISIATYLQSLGNAPARILFCSRTKEYDGVFRWDDGKEVRLELTRAIGGKNGGKNEGLVQELLDKEGTAPLGQTIHSSGTKKNRQFFCNEPRIATDLHKTNIPARLKLALKNKNDQKYKGYWLVITVPLYSFEDTFYEACARFWRNTYKASIPFDRVLVIPEEFIKYSDAFSIKYDEIQLNISTRIKKRNLEDSIWDSWNDDHKIHFLLRLPNNTFDSTEGKELYTLLFKAPDSLLLKNLYNITKWLLQASENMLQDNELRFLELFDRIAQCVCKTHIAARLDNPINEAFNHPVGELTRAILLLLSQRLKTSNQVSHNIQLRLTNLIQNSNHNQLISLILTFLSLRWLFEIDKRWVKEHVLKHFKWGQQNQETQYVWQAFISGIYSIKPTLPHELFSEIKQDFLESIKHVNQKEAHQNLCYILIHLFFCEDQYLTKEDLSKKFLEDLSIEQLEHMSFAIFQLLDAAKEKSHELWTNKINSWIKTNWPQGQQFVSSEISDNFVKAAIESRDAFGEAIKTLSSLNLLTISQELFILLNKLINSDFPKQFSNETLVLLDKICPPNFKSINFIFSEKEKLRGILWIIKNENSEILDRSLYKKLLDYV
jgi:hypothetical protein